MPRIGHNSPIWRCGGQARTFALPGRTVPSPPILLKADELGRIEIVEREGVRMIRRDIGAARWWARAFARRAAAREARALAKLAGIGGVPALLGWDGRELLRSYMAGRPMQQAQPRERAYYRDALRLLCRLHRRGVVHNDLAKEPNWLVCEDGRPAVVDFQIAWTRGAAARCSACLRARTCATCSSTSAPIARRH